MPIVNIRDGDGEIKEALAILIGGGSSIQDAVLYTEQNLTPEQQGQARENIGATPSFHGTITVCLGDELIDTTCLPTLGTNWSGDYENGFHHTSGST